MNLKLVKVSLDYKKQIFDMLDEWYSTGEKIVPYAIRKLDYHDFDKYCEGIEVKDASEGKVPDSTYFCLNIDRNIMVGAVGPYWGKEDESSLFTIFVLPDYQGKGIGRTIIETLEKDEYFTRAKRVEIPASITGTPFYLKMGYIYKNGIDIPDEEGLLRLEKYR